MVAKVNIGTYLLGSSPSEGKQVSAVSEPSQPVLPQDAWPVWKGRPKSGTKNSLGVSMWVAGAQVPEASSASLDALAGSWTEAEQLGLAPGARALGHQPESTVPRSHAGHDLLVGLRHLPGG